MASNDTRLWYMYDVCGTLSHASCRASVWIWKTLPVLLISVGTCGNLLNIAILSRRRMRTSSTTFYLLALSVSDLIFLWTGALRTSLVLGVEFDMLTLSSFNCALHRWVASTAASVSIWMLVILTVERLVYTRKPMTAKVQFTRTRAVVVVSVLLVVFIASYSHHAYGFRLKPHNQAFPGGGNITSGNKLVCTFVSLEYAYFYKHGFTLFTLFVLNVIPFTIIVIGNVTIGLTLLKQRRKRRGRTQSGSVRKSLGKRNIVAVRMLFVLSTVFVVTTLPYFIYQAVLYRATKLSTDQFANMKLVQAIIYNIFMANFTFNFFLYFGSGTMFKRELILIVKEVKIKCFREKEVDNSAINIPMNSASMQKFLESSSEEGGTSL